MMVGFGDIERFSLDELPPGNIMVIKKMPNGIEWASILPEDKDTWISVIQRLKDFNGIQKDN